MTALTNGETQTRKSVPLTARDLADLEMVRRSPEAQRAVGITIEGMSEATLLHALLAHALQHAREAVEEASYAALAADPEQKAYETALRRRSRRRAELTDE
jgi:hypothetical protein